MSAQPLQLYSQRRDQEPTFAATAAKVIKGALLLIEDGVGFLVTSISEGIDNQAGNFSELKKIVDTFSEHKSSIVNGMFGMACLYNFWRSRTIFILAVLVGIAFSTRRFSGRYFGNLQDKPVLEKNSSRFKIGVIFSACVNYSCGRAGKFFAFSTALFIGNAAWHSSPARVQGSISALVNQISLKSLIAFVFEQAESGETPPT